MLAVLRTLALGIVLVWPIAVTAQQGPAERARAASKVLDAASAQLEAAQSARDRVRALTQTISAFEDGLAALRSGVRQGSLRVAELEARLQAREADIGTLLSLLHRAGQKETPVALLHPGGALGTARAGMLLAEVVPALNAQAETLRQELAELQTLQALQSVSTDRLAEGLAEVQTARAALNQAIADRTALPKRFTADPVREAILLSSADTLDAFAAGLDQISAAGIPATPAALPDMQGDLPLPVQGRLLYAAGARDAAGIARPGIIVATRPQALVTSPVAATLRYVGPLLDFGQVVILEPQTEVLFVLAGLDTVYGETGDMVSAGGPLGLMGDGRQKNGNRLSTDGDHTGADRSETLYIEVRQDNTPEDPSLWFRTDRNG